MKNKQILLRKLWASNFTEEKFFPRLLIFKHVLFCFLEAVIIKVKQPQSSSCMYVYANTTNPFLIIIIFKICKAFLLTDCIKMFLNFQKIILCLGPQNIIVDSNFQKTWNKHRFFKESLASFGFFFKCVNFLGALFYIFKVIVLFE